MVKISIAYWKDIERGGSAHLMNWVAISAYSKRTFPRLWQLLICMASLPCCLPLHTYLQAALVAKGKVRGCPAMDLQMILWEAWPPYRRGFMVCLLLWQTQASDHRGLLQPLASGPFGGSNAAHWQESYLSSVLQTHGCLTLHAVSSFLMQIRELCLITTNRKTFSGLSE